jgi:ABC-2 type transport system permease protein
MKSIIALYKATAREFLRDRMAILFTVLLPLLMAVFFGMIFGNQQSAFHFDLGVALEDRGPIGQEVAKGFSDPAVQQTVTVHTGTRDELLAQLKNGKIAVVMVLPSDLSAKVGSKQPSNVEVYWDKNHESVAGPGLSMVRQMLQQMDQKLSGAPNLLLVQETAVAQQQISQAQLYVPGMLALGFLWLGVFGVAPPLVQQREQQVLRRIGATPLSRSRFMGAQVAWRLTTGLLQGALLLAYGLIAYRMQIVNPLGVLGFVVLGAAVLIALGLLLASVARTNESVIGLGQVIQFPMMFLSGILFPLELLPSFLRPVVNAMPLTYLGDALRQTMLGAPALFPLWVDAAVLGSCLIAFAGLAVRFFRWE